MDSYPFIFQQFEIKIKSKNIKKLILELILNILSRTTVLSNFVKFQPQIFMKFYSRIFFREIWDVLGGNDRHHGNHFRFLVTSWQIELTLLNHFGSLGYFSIFGPFEILFKTVHLNCFLRTFVKMFEPGLGPSWSPWTVNYGLELLLELNQARILLHSSENWYFSWLFT